MSEFKGTPGPWFIKPVPDCTMEGAVNVIQTHNNNGLGFHIAYASGWIDDEQTKAEADANARILAAAPELLEVCLRIQAQFRQAGVESKAGSLNPIEDNAAQIDAVILKALGQ